MGLSKFAHHTKLGGPADLVDGYDAIQTNSKDLRSEPMKNSRSSSRPSAWSCAWVRAILVSIQTGGMDGLRAALKRRAWQYWWRKNWTWSGNVCLQPRKANTSWAVPKAAWSAGWRRLFFPSTLCFSEISSWKGVLLWNPVQGRMDMLEQIQRIPTRMVRGLEQSEMERVGVAKPRQEKTLGRPYCILSVY